MWYFQSHWIIRVCKLISPKPGITFKLPPCKDIFFSQIISRYVKLMKLFLTIITQYYWLLVGFILDICQHHLNNINFMNRTYTYVYICAIMHMCGKFLFSSPGVSLRSELVLAIENNYFFHSFIFSSYFILVKIWNLTWIHPGWDTS